MLFLLEKILKHMDKVIPSAGNSVDGKLLDCYYSISVTTELFCKYIFQLFVPFLINSR